MNKKDLMYWVIFFSGIVVLILGVVENDLFVKFVGFVVMLAVISFTFLKWLYKEMKEEENDSTE